MKSNDTNNSWKTMGTISVVMSPGLSLIFQSGSLSCRAIIFFHFSKLVTGRKCRRVSYWSANYSSVFDDYYFWIIGLYLASEMGLMTRMRPETMMIYPFELLGELWTSRLTQDMYWHEAWGESWTCHFKVLQEEICDITSACSGPIAA